MALRNHAGRIESDSSRDSEQATNEISDLLHGRLTTEEATKLRERIKRDPQLLDQALHYSRHHVAMQNQTQAVETQKPASSFRQSFVDTVIRFFQFETAVWKLAPLAAVLIVVVMFNGLQRSQERQLPGIVQFEDQSGLVFVAQETQPGIGFFANTRQIAEPFEGVTLHLNSPREIVFSWPEIDGALNYRLKLQVFRNGETLVLGNALSKQPQARIQLQEPLGQHRYEWILTGDTVDKQSFYASGGFVALSR